MNEFGWIQKTKPKRTTHRLKCIDYNETTRCLINVSRSLWQWSRHISNGKVRFAVQIWLQCVMQLLGQSAPQSAWFVWMRCVWCVKQLRLCSWVIGVSGDSMWEKFNWSISLTHASMYKTQLKGQKGPIFLTYLATLNRNRSCYKVQVSRFERSLANWESWFNVRAFPISFHFVRRFCCFLIKSKHFEFFHFDWNRCVKFHTSNNT